MKKIVALISLLLAVSASAFAASVSGDLRLKLENKGDNTTFKYDKTALSLSGSLDGAKVKTTFDIKTGSSVSVKEAFVEFGPAVVGMIKIPFGVNNYGAINTPLAVSDWNGASLLGFWVKGTASQLQYQAGLFNDGDEPAKGQLAWANYGVSDDIDLVASFVNKEDDTSFSVGALYTVDALLVSGEYVGGSVSDEDLSGFVAQARYGLLPALNVYGSYSQLAQGDAEATKEGILGAQYTITKGLTWETEYKLDPDEDENNLLTSRLKVKF
jgi:hypothetical protein